MPERATADRHLPVMLERVVELLAPALQAEGAVHVDATLGMGGHAEAVLERCPAARVIGIDRDTQALVAGPRAPRPVRRAVHRRPRRPRRARRGARPRGRGHRPRHPVRPRRAPRSSSTRPSAASPTGTTRLSTCGWTRAGAPPRPTCSTPTSTASSRGSCGPTARSASPGGSPRPSCASARRSRSRPRPGSSRSCRSAVPAATRRSGGHPAKRTFQALRIEVNGELEAWRAAVEDRPRRARAGWPGRRPRLPLPRGPHRQARLRRAGAQPHAPPACPSSCRRTHPRCGC